MSVGYSVGYTIKIKGSRADIEQIPAILKENAPFRQWVQDRYCWQDGGEYGKYLPEKMDSLVRDVKNCLEQDGAELVLDINSRDEDVTHGIMEAMLNCISGVLPMLGIAILAYGRCYEEYLRVARFYGSYYSPPNMEQKITLSGIFYFGENDRTTFPHEDWIPEWWHEERENDYEYDDDYDGEYDEE